MNNPVQFTLIYSLELSVIFYLIMFINLKLLIHGLYFLIALIIP